MLHKCAAKRMCVRQAGMIRHRGRACAAQLCRSAWLALDQHEAVVQPTSQLHAGWQGQGQVSAVSGGNPRGDAIELLSRSVAEPMSAACQGTVPEGLDGRPSRTPAPALSTYLTHADLSASCCVPRLPHLQAPSPIVTPAAATPPHHCPYLHHLLPIQVGHQLRHCRALVHVVAKPAVVGAAPAAGGGRERKGGGRQGSCRGRQPGEGCCPGGRGGRCPSCGQWERGPEGEAVRAGAGEGSQGRDGDIRAGCEGGL